MWTDVDRQPASEEKRVSNEDLFAASDNAEAVRWVRDYIDDLDAAVARCRHRADDGEPCSVCVEREHIASEIRSLLPALGEGDASG